GRPSAAAETVDEGRDRAPGRVRWTAGSPQPFWSGRVRAAASGSVPPPTALALRARRSPRRTGRRVTARRGGPPGAARGEARPPFRRVRRSGAIGGARRACSAGLLAGRRGARLVTGAGADDDRSHHPTNNVLALRLRQ